MFGLCKTFHTRRNQSAERTARLEIEHLEGRALPSGFGSLLPTAGLGQVTADLTHIRSDVQALTRLAGSTASGDLTTIRTDLRTLVGDVLAGKDTTTDLKTLATDEAKLLTDLGSTAGARVQRLLTNIQHDLQALIKDVNGLGTSNPGKGHDRDEDRDDRRGEDRDDDRRGEDRDDDRGDEGGQGLNLGQLGKVIGDLLSVRRDLQALTTALGSSISQTVAQDLSAVRTALGTVVGDLLSGTNPTSDLNALKSALNTLVSDIGTGASTQVQGLLTTLRNDVQRLVTDVTALTNPAQAALQRVQADLTRLEGQLGSSLSTAAQADVAALDAAITAIGTDIGAGNAITGDLIQALTSEFNLLQDLSGTLPGATQQSLLNLAMDLTRLGILSRV